MTDHPDKLKRHRGRPAEMEKGRSVRVYLDEASIELARKIGKRETGKGNISAGIRAALEAAY